MALLSDDVELVAVNDPFITTEYMVMRSLFLSGRESEKLYLVYSSLSFFPSLFSFELDSAMWFARPV